MSRAARRRSSESYTRRRSCKACVAGARNCALESWALIRCITALLGQADGLLVLGSSACSCPFASIPLPTANTEHYKAPLASPLATALAVDAAAPHRPPLSGAVGRPVGVARQRHQAGRPARLFHQ